MLAHKAKAAMVQFLEIAIKAKRFNEALCCITRHIYVMRFRSFRDLNFAREWL
jgi:hypothetical protein